MTLQWCKLGPLFCPPGCDCTCDGCTGIVTSGETMAVAVVRAPWWRRLLAWWRE